jgi:hypothetical protein
MTKTILIDGRQYAEKKPKPPTNALGEVCSQCAFGLGRLTQCAQAIEGSPEVFGGDCAERDVIYTEVPA